MVFVFASKDKIGEDKTRHSCTVPHRAVHPTLPNHPWECRWVCAAEDVQLSLQLPWKEADIKSLLQLLKSCANHLRPKKTELPVSYLALFFVPIPQCCLL